MIKIFAKKALFFTIMQLVVLLAGELLLRAFYYQHLGSHLLAWGELFADLQQKTLTWKAHDLTKEMLTPQQEAAFVRLLEEDPEGQTLRQQYFQQYAREFQTLVDETARLQVKLLVLYIPLPRRAIPPDAPQAFIDFVRGVAEQHGVEFIDLRTEFYPYPAHLTSLLPEDDHPSRFGNQIVAEALVERLKQYRNLKTTYAFPARPALYGDLPPATAKQWRQKKQLPYLVTVNHQGLRMPYDLAFPKSKQRILILGDSMTFGPYLHDVHTYPAMLERLLGDAEVINAAVIGYTISDEVELFRERAQYVEPDLVILQVIDNDIHGLSAYMKNLFDRKRRSYAPTPLERRVKAKAVQQAQ